MKKIYLVVTPFFPEPGSFRGPYVLDQVKALMRLSDYHVVVMKPVPLWMKPVDYEIDGVYVYCCKDYSLPSNLWPNSLCDRLSANSMMQKLCSMDIRPEDVAVCHGHVTHFATYALAMKRKNPKCLTVVQHHGFDVMSITDGRLAEKKWHERQCIRYGTRICNAVDLNIGVSQKTLDHVRQYPGVKMKREYILYNGVDTSKFYASPVKHDGFVIGCIANFWQLKDQLTLIKAVERMVKDGLNDILVRFIGSGGTLADCQEYVNRLGLNQYVSFEKEVMHDELLQFYNSLDIFVLPSYWEAFGCVYTEAYACGVPFVGVKGQGISELIPEEDQDKWLIDKGDDVHLAEIIAEYHKTRSEQILNKPWKIEDLVGRYLKYIMVFN